MNWLVIVVIIAVIGLMIVSPTFRWLVIGMLMSGRGGGSGGLGGGGYSRGGGGFSGRGGSSGGGGASGSW